MKILICDYEDEIKRQLGYEKDLLIKGFAKYGVNVFGLDSAMDKKQLAEKAIEATAAFYKEIGLPCTLKEAGIDNSRIDEMARHIADNEGLDKAYMALDLADIKEILTASL